MDALAAYSSNSGGSEDEDEEEVQAARPHGKQGSEPAGMRLPPPDFGLGGLPAPDFDGTPGAVAPMPMDTRLAKTRIGCGAPHAWSCTHAWHGHARPLSIPVGAYSLRGGHCNKRGWRIPPCFAGQGGTQGGVRYRGAGHLGATPPRFKMRLQ